MVLIKSADETKNRVTLEHVFQNSDLYEGHFTVIFGCDLVDRSVVEINNQGTVS